MLVAVIVRLAFKFYADNVGGLAESIYGAVIVQYSQLILGFWCFYTLKKVGNKIMNFAPIQKTVKVLDDASYYVYIVHQMFVLGSLNVMKMTDNAFLNTIVFILLTLVSTFILKFLSELVFKVLSAKSKTAKKQTT